MFEISPSEYFMFGVFMMSNEKLTSMWTDKAIDFAKRDIFVMTSEPNNYWLEVSPEQR